jgi:hypothetical protein
MIILHRNRGMNCRSWLARIRRQPRLTRWPFGVEIAIALVLKLALLALIWNAFFAAPQAKKMRMPTPQVEQHFLTPAPLPGGSGVRPESPSTVKAAHDSNR